MRSKVCIVDYGMGNLLSVFRAFKHCGADVLVTNSPDMIKKAERLVLPGVGAFRDGMRELKALNLIEPIINFSESERPFLGICLGMQMMLDSSDEFGSQPGLGLIPGKVVAIPETTEDGVMRKIPHIGWNSLVLPDNRSSWRGTILEGLASHHASVYFVHSFFVQPESEAYRLADCDYNGFRITAAIYSGTLYGCQFHPEKSGNVGLKVLENFCVI